MYDFVVIGGGSAGYAAARTAVGLGLRTAVVDGAEELGGLCILRGCMPSKAIIESANRAMTIRRAAEFGLSCGPLAIHPQEIMERKRRLIAEFASYRQGQLQRGDFDLIRGTARFESANRIQVTLRGGGSQLLETGTSLIATGSKISLPPVPGLKEAKPWTSDDVLAAERLPKSIAILGGGAIALEMAHYLAALGVRVCLIQRSRRLLSHLDSGAGEAVQASFERRGMEVHCDTRLERVEQGPGAGKTVWFAQAGEDRKVEVEEILVALGRRAAISSLGLEQIGVNVREGRVEVGRNQETSVPGVYAAGDVCGPLEVVHLAIEQGELAAWNAARRIGAVAGAEGMMDYRLKLFGVFCEPQVAMVGPEEQELRATGRRIGSADYPFDDHGKSMVQGETEGFVKLWADLDSGEILAGLVVGPEAVELIHEVVVGMRFHATAEDLVRTPHYHPSLAEIWTYPAEELAGKVGVPTE